ARRAVTPWVSRCLRPGVTDPMAPAPPTRRKGTRLMSTRREFVQGLAAAVGSPLLVNGTAAQPPAPSTGPDVGSLFPFIRSQAVKTDFPLSFLDKSFTDLAGWTPPARGKLQALLRYAPPACDPRREVVERADRGDHVCERVLFNTTPDVRVPAYVLVPKKADRPLPAVVALHDHGGFYLWGKEKLVEDGDEHPALTAFKKRYYAGTSTATALARQGYVVAVIDMFYWGERRMLLD